MTEQEALAIVKAMADGKPMIRWPEAERWEAVCIVLLKLQRDTGPILSSLVDKLVVDT